MAHKSSEAQAQKRNKTKLVIIFKSRGRTVNNNLQSEPTAEQHTGLVLEKECDRAVLCHLSYSVYTQRA